MNGDPANTAVRVLNHGQPMKVNALWEFMFYTEHFPDIPNTTLQVLRAEVDKLIAKRFKNNVVDDPDAFVRELQTMYDKRLGGNPARRNRISLWMYAGPIGEWWAWFRSEECDLNYRSITRHGWGPYIKTPRGACTHHWRGKQQGAVMYTGDCDVSDPVRLQNALQHFQPHRVQRTGLLQVPHHGADANWSPGNGLAWPHLHAAISAGTTNRHGHPGAMVMGDIAAHGHCPLRAHEGQRVLCRGGAAWKV